MDNQEKDKLVSSIFGQNAAPIKPVHPQEPLNPGSYVPGEDMGQETSYTEDGEMVNFSAEKEDKNE
jgi:hypothetical protein